MGPLLLLLSLVSLQNGLSLSVPYSSDWESFHKYAMDYNKPYINDSVLMTTRFKIFQESLIRHQRLNKYESQNGGHATYGVNKFSDLTPEEFASTYLLCLQSSHLSSDVTLASLSSDTIPHPSLSDDVQALDWRDHNVITPIKNQEKCGSCWAFSVVEVLESRLAIQTNSPQLIPLSVQQIISCDYNPTFLLNGCKGGALPNAFQSLQTSGMVIVADSIYPFASSDGDTKSCRQNLPATGVTLKNYTYISRINETLMKSFITNNGPTANSVNAVMWQDYSSGIIQHHCTSDPIDHAVQVVGFNLNDGPVPYWIVRNTWGSDWGENGYVRLKYNDNTCGIASEVVTVLEVNSNM